MQDNKALFWLSIAVRGANAVLFASFGGKWTALAGAAAVIAGIMFAVMLFDSRKGRRGRVRKGEEVRSITRFRDGWKDSLHM